MHIPPRPRGGSECPRGENKTISAPPARTYLRRAHVQLGGRREGGLVRQTASARGARYTSVRSRPPRRAPTDEGQGTSWGGERCPAPPRDNLRVSATAPTTTRTRRSRDYGEPRGWGGGKSEYSRSSSVPGEMPMQSMPLRLLLSGSSGRTSRRHNHQHAPPPSKIGSVSVSGTFLDI